MARKQESKSNWTHLFEVDSPSDHRKGFTVYRITSKVYLRNLPESVTKIVVWKRFNDIKKLYKELKTIHGDLYLKGEFPDFPNSNVFKRFDYDVIEERRKSALDLLVFASGHLQLYTSSAFLKFFQDGYDSNDVFYHGKSDDTESSDKDMPFQECLVPEKLWTSSNQECDEDDESRTTDTESLNSSDIFTNTLESPSKASTSTTSVSKMHKSRSALYTEPISNFDDLVLSDEDEVEEYSRPNVSSKSKSVISSNSCSSLSLGESTLSLNNTRNDQQSSSLSSTKHLIQESINNLLEFLPIFPKRVETRVATSDQILSESLNESYICEAAGHFTLAQQHESNNEYLNAFQSYKEGIRILLHGVQRDSNTSRKLLVRKKLEKYLSKAEQIHDIIQNLKKDSNHTSNSNKFQSFLFNKFKLLNEDKIETESTNKISKLQIQMMPSNLIELKDYKVIGLSSNSLFIVMDTKYVTGPKSYALKVLQKTNKLTNYADQLNNIIPQNVPFMVTLKKWYNLENSIILLLQYASGGNLRDFIHSYQRKDIPFVIYNNEVEDIDESSQVKHNMKKEKDSKLVENELNEITIQDESDIPHLIEPESIASVEKKSNENDIFDVVISKDDDLIVSETGNHSLLSSPLKDSKPFDGPSWSNLDAFDTELLIDSSKKLLQGISTTLAELDQKQKQSEEGDKISNTTILKESLPEKTGNESIDINSKNLTVTSPTNSSKGMFKSKSDQNLIRYNNKNVMDDDSSTKEEKEAIPKSFYSPKKTLLIFEEIPAKRMVPECSVKVWASEIILSLEKLHSFGLAFGDLEMKNIMLGESGHILLTYKSFWTEVEQVLARGNINSAPEVRYSFGTSLSKIRPFSDWWSFGAILFELLIGQSVDSVFIEGFHPQTIIRIPDQNICGQKISEKAKSLLVELLQHNPRSRLGYYGAEDVKTHPFFEEIDWNSLK